MDWNPSILNFTEAKYSEYNEWLVIVGFWDDTEGHFVYTSNVLTNTTQGLLFCSNLFSTEEPKASNLCIESLCEELYPFINLYQSGMDEMVHVLLLTIKHP